MIHYHGLPITPATAAIEAVGGGHAFVSFLHQQQVGIALSVCQSFAVDNGAFSAWKSGRPITDWSPFYAWVESLCRHPSFDWAVMPDDITGDAESNDRLLDQWPLARHIGAPVWHMHEPIERLVRLAREWPRICLGSSGGFAQVGSSMWWDRMNAAMASICDEHGLPITKLHGLRMLNPSVFSHLPLASADSTNIAQNVGIDVRWKGTYAPPTKEARARLIRLRIEAYNGADRWNDPIFT